MIMAARVIRSGSMHVHIAGFHSVGLTDNDLFRAMDRRGLQWLGSTLLRSRKSVKLASIDTGQEANMADGTEFYVRLNGIKLPAAEEKRIAAEVRATVLRELARTNVAPTDGGLAMRIPKEWLGLWLDRIRGAGGGLPGLPKNIETIR